MKRIIYGALAFLLSTLSAIAQQGVPYFPQILPAGTIVGRLQTSAGPTEAIPFAILAAQISPLTFPNYTFSSTQSIPINVYQQSGETTRFAGNVFAGTNPGGHTGQEKSMMEFSYMPVGSGTNGPNNADYAFTVSNLKNNFATTAVVGEVDGIVSVVRQGGTGSDSTGLLANVAHYGTGNLSAYEGTSSLIPGGTVTMQMSTQAGILNNITASYIGFHAFAQVGSLGAAFHADTSSPSTWAFLFQGLVNGSQVWAVDGNGNMTLSGGNITSTGGNLTLTGGNFASTGGTATLTRTTSATTTPFLNLQQSGTGNVFLQWLITSTQAWTAGIDTADSNAWKLDPNNDAFVSTVLRVSTTGVFTVLPKFAIPAGGTQDAGLSFSTTNHFGIFFGSGAPTLSAAQGSLYIRSDGSSTSTRLYVNTNGTTGWTNFTSGS